MLHVQNRYTLVIFFDVLFILVQATCLGSVEHIQIFSYLKSARSPKNYMFPRESQHTLEHTPKWKEFLHKVLVIRVWGIFHRECWKILRTWYQKWWFGKMYLLSKMAILGISILNFKGGSVIYNFIFRYLPPTKNDHYLRHLRCADQNPGEVSSKSLAPYAIYGIWDTTIRSVNFAPMKTRKRTVRANVKCSTSWWLNQPNWKICSSWIIFPNIRGEHSKNVIWVDTNLRMSNKRLQ